MNPRQPCAAPFIFRHRDGPCADARPEDAGPGAVKGARRGGSAADVAADALWAGAVADAAEAVFRGGPVAVPEAGAPRDAAEGAGPGAGDVRDASAEDGHRAGAVEDAPVAEGNAREAAGPACRHSCAAFRERRAVGAVRVSGAERDGTAVSGGLPEGKRSPPERPVPADRRQGSEGSDADSCGPPAIL